MSTCSKSASSSAGESQVITRVRYRQKTLWEKMHSTIGGRKEKKNCHPGKAEFLHEAISTDGDLFHPQEIRDSLSGGYVEKGILAK